MVIAGPTGSGKSGLALRLAHRFHGEIVNCDSVQIYRHFRIGAAKLAPEEQEGIPHHMLDVAEPDETYTAGDYSRQARAAIRGITVRHHLPIVVGGTGFYLRALIEGLFEGPARDEAIRSRLAGREAKRAGSLHRILRRLDPAAAKRIHAKDVNKVMRALEVILIERKPLTVLHEEGRDALEGYRVLRLGLNPPRAELYARLDARAAAMFREGLLEETQSILDRGYAGASKPFESLGYAQALRVLRGEMSVEAAIAETQLQTRQYAKRQWTWFRRDKNIVWLDGFGGNEDVAARAEEHVRGFLG